MKLFSIVLLIFSAIVSSNAAIDAEVVNKNVERTIDLTSQLVKTSYKIIAEHSAKKGITSYSLVIPRNERQHLAFISAKDSSKKELKYTEKEISNGVEFLLSFPSAAPTQVIYVETVATKSLVPHPAKISQAEKQLVRYFGGIYFYSPYKTLTQKTTVHLSSSSIESYTQTKPVGVSGSTISYGPYENVEAYNAAELVIHFENHTPFLSVTRLERTLEVSHWGNIAVTENIDMVHSGAQLKGSFSRYEFQKDARSGQAAVKSYKTMLPASATGVYYRDTNGNISTSNMKVLRDSVELDLRPRFPLFGGWRTFYTLGYNVPSFEYLFNSGENFLLKMRIIDHIYDDMVVDEATVKIILPEGASNIKLITPYSVSRLPDSLHYTYLDTFGRPVISFTKKNLVENHIHDFNLKYNFSRVTMLHEPLLAVGFFFALFVLVIICLRLDFSISKEKEPHTHKE